MYMTLKDIINKLWYITQIVIIEAAVWDQVRESGDLETIKSVCRMSGGVNATRTELYKQYMDRYIDGIGIIEDHLIITIK